MVGTNGSAPCGINPQLRRGADRDQPLNYFAHMNKDTGRFLGIRNTNNPAVDADVTAIANLTTRFSIERRLVQNQLHAVALPGLADLAAILDQSNNLALGLLGVIAKEIRVAVFVSDIKPDGAVCTVAGA